MITVAGLTAKIMQRIETYNNDDFPLLKREVVSYDLLDSRNHILATDIVSPFAVPRQNLSAMDGYALAQGSTLDAESTIAIVGESQAGSPYNGDIVAGQGVRIFTGAVVPDSCDTVVRQENTNYDDIKNSIDESEPYDITLSRTVNPKVNIRKQGEEIEAREVVL